MLDQLPDFGGDTAGAHDLMSKFTHPRSLSLLFQYDSREMTAEFRIGGTFNRADLRIALHVILQVAAGVLPPVQRLQERWIGTSEPRWVRVTNAHVQKVIEYIRVANQNLPD